MSLATSEVSFEARATAIGLQADVVEKLKKAGYSCFSDFAYSTTYIPGQTDDTAFVDRVLVPVLGAGDDPRAPKLRRLLFESYAIATDELKSRASRTQDDAPKKMPDRERESRLEGLRARLPGLATKGKFEPAACLIDTAADMLESGWRYLPWCECISKQEELAGLKKIKEFKADSQGVLREVVKSDTLGLRTDMGSDLRVYQLLHRRGIALDVANVMRFEQHDVISKLLIEEMQRDQPVGYSALSLEQLQRADKEVWSKIGESVAAVGLHPNHEGKLPAGVAAASVIDHPTVRMMLLPLATSAPARTSQPPASSASLQPSQQTSQSVQGPQSRKRPRSTPKPAAKAVAKAPPKPPAHIGGSSVTPDNAHICWAYNERKCPVQGRGCGKGKHVCTRCFGDHPAIDCKKDSFQ